MSESLLFAILGFLVACLFGTVFASLLWRRAVTVTKRRLGLSDTANQDENTTSRSELEELRHRLGEKDLQVRNLRVESERQINDLAESDNNTKDEMRRQLASAARELEKAGAERDQLKIDRDRLDRELAASRENLATSSTRVHHLEKAIRALAESAGLSTPEATPSEPASGLQTKSDQNADETHNEAEMAEPAVASVQTGPEQAPENDTNDKDSAPDAVVAASRSLEERIEALMHSQKTH